MVAERGNSHFAPIAGRPLPSQKLSQAQLLRWILRPTSMVSLVMCRMAGKSMPAWPRVVLILPAVTLFVCFWLHFRLRAGVNCFTDFLCWGFHFDLGFARPVCAQWPPSLSPLLSVTIVSWLWNLLPKAPPPPPCTLCFQWRVWEFLLQGVGRGVCWRREAISLSLGSKLSWLQRSVSAYGVGWVVVYFSSTERWKKGKKNTRQWIGVRMT